MHLLRQDSEMNEIQNNPVKHCTSLTRQYRTFLTCLCMQTQFWLPRILELAELMCQCSVADGLMYFKGLIDMECFQSKLEKLEKLCNSNSCVPRTRLGIPPI